MKERELLDMLHARFSYQHGGAPRYVCAEHVSDTTGHRGGGRIADMLVQDTYVEWVGPNGRTARPDWRLVDGEWITEGEVQDRIQLHGFEIKVSRSDWLSELRDPSKADAWRRFCDRWWLVAPANVVKPDELPSGWGLMVPVCGVRPSLRVMTQAPRLDPEPMSPRTRAALLRAAATTAERRAIARLSLVSAGQNRRPVPSSVARGDGTGSHAGPHLLQAVTGAASEQKGRPMAISVEYGIFNDEGMLEGDCYSLGEAEARRETYYADYDEDDPRDLTIEKVCPTCRGGIDGACENCDEDED